jgi:pilus assembly protein Flp/PilA
MFSNLKIVAAALARQDEEGAALVEYGMLAGLVVVACIAAVTLLGTEISTAFSSIAASLGIGNPTVGWGSR